MPLLLGWAEPGRAADVSSLAAQAGGSWEIQGDNLSPPGHVWGFNAFYPDRLAAHPGDTLTFRLAENVNAFHQVTLMPAGFLPAQGYPGFTFPDPYVPGGYQTTFFNNGPNFSQQPGTTLCGRAGEAPCAYTGKAALNSGVLLAPAPESGARGNRTFAIAIDPSLTAGSYFFLCLVHGPTMNGRIDVRPAGEPLQTSEALRSDAARAYQDDLLELDRAERAGRTPSFRVEQDGSKTWLLPVGGGGGRLSVDQFGV